MIIIKNKKEIEAMRKASRIAKGALVQASKYVSEGVTTKELDKLIYEYILSKGATPSFLGYNEFPASACISINQEVIHGIPGKRQLKNGDIVSIDVGAFINGFHGDCADTFFVGDVDEKAKKLVEVTKSCFYEGLKAAKAGNRLYDIGAAVDEMATKNGFTTVKEFVGHGIGRDLHEEPSVPNFGSRGKGIRLCSGMTLAIEPMINEGTEKIKILSDRWTVVTNDNRLSAHYENTILITDGEPEILTIAEG